MILLRQSISPFPPLTVSLTLSKDTLYSIIPYHDPDIPYRFKTAVFRFSAAAPSSSFSSSVSASFALNLSSSLSSPPIQCVVVLSEADLLSNFYGFLGSVLKMILSFSYLPTVVFASSNVCLAFSTKEGRKKPCQRGILMFEGCGTPQ